MLDQVFPRAHCRYSSLPLLGGMVEDFARWLLQNGYPLEAVRRHLRHARRVDSAMRQHGCRSPREITREILMACAPPADCPSYDRFLAAAVCTLLRYLEEKGLIAPPCQPCPHSHRLLAEYRSFLEDVRGFADSTVANHLATVAQLLDHLNYEKQSPSLINLSSGEIENFVRVRGRRISRASLQHEIAHVRSFLRFLTSRGDIPSGLDTQIDTPRVYRLEQLPRALPWKTVLAFLQSIDRSNPRGSRDYAMFLLMATYGLRASEVVALKLEDVEWRAGQIHVRQIKTTNPLLLPLTDAVGEGLIDYFRRGRPALPHREIFLRSKAPAGCLTTRAVAEAFKTWTRRSGLSIPSLGPHCIRHSYAVHLLRQGISLKTIGDILGHRNAESTCVYLRLAVDDLRDVALSLPENANGGRP